MDSVQIFPSTEKGQNSHTSKDPIFDRNDNGARGTVFLVWKYLPYTVFGHPYMQILNMAKKIDAELHTHTTPESRWTR